jgi:hypothetical protein
VQKNGGCDVVVSSVQGVQQVCVMYGGYRGLDVVVSSVQGVLLVYVMCAGYGGVM